MLATELKLWARSFLEDVLDADPDDPDYPKWETRCFEMLERYAKLTPKCRKPLGADWPGEYSGTIDEVLDIIERKIKAAEDVLG